MSDSDINGVILSIIGAPILFCAYQFGLDFLDFDGASNMLEFFDEDDEDQNI